MPESWKNLIELWCNSEPILYLIGNEQGKVYLNRTLKFTLPITPNIIQEIKERETILENDELSIYEKESVMLESVDDLKAFCRQAQKTERNHSINFQNIGKSEKRSNLECRISAGTIIADEAINHINLFGRIIESAEEIAIIQQKDPENRTDNENKRLQAFIKLTTQVQDLEQKLELLLKIMDFNPMIEKVYRDRYDINYPIVINNPRLKKVIIDSFETKPVNLNSIFKKTMLESSPVTGQDYQTIERLILHLQEQEHYLQN